MGRPSFPFWLALGFLLLALAFTCLPSRQAVSLSASFATFPEVLEAWRETIIGGWTPPALPAAASQTLFRTYTDRQGEVVALTIAYWPAQPPGAIAFTQEYAAPGRDWAYVREEALHIPLPSRWGAALPATRTLFTRRGEGELVTYWFIQPGRRIVGSRYWGRAYLLWDKLTSFRSDVAMVRVSTRSPVHIAGEAPALHEAFIQAALPALDRVFLE